MTALAKAQTSTIQSLLPQRSPAGGTSFTLSVLATYYEAGWGPNPIVLWNGAPRPTSNAPCPLPRVAILDCVQATIPASDIASPGTATVSVMGTNVVSNTLTFTIDPPGQVVAVPTLSTKVAMIFGVLLASVGLLALSRGFRH